MDALTLILLLLFVIGAGVALYYGCMCFRAKSHDRDLAKDCDEHGGPLLPADHNGNLDAAPTHLSLEEPDGVKSKVPNGGPIFEGRGADVEAAVMKADNHPRKKRAPAPLPLPVTPECAANDVVVVLPLDEEPPLPLTVSKPLLPPPPPLNLADDGLVVQPAMIVSASSVSPRKQVHFDSTAVDAPGQPVLNEAKSIPAMVPVSVPSPIVVSTVAACKSAPLIEQKKPKMVARSVPFVDSSGGKVATAAAAASVAAAAMHLSSQLEPTSAIHGQKHNFEGETSFSPKKAKMTPSDTEKAKITPSDAEKAKMTPSDAKQLGWCFDTPVINFANTLEEKDEASLLPSVEDSLTQIGFDALDSSSSSAALREPEGNDEVFDAPNGCWRMSASDTAGEQTQSVPPKDDRLSSGNALGCDMSHHSGSRLSTPSPAISDGGSSAPEVTEYSFDREEGATTSEANAVILADEIGSYSSLPIGPTRFAPLETSPTRSDPRPPTPPSSANDSPVCATRILATPPTTPPPSPSIASVIVIANPLAKEVESNEVPVCNSVSSDDDDDSSSSLSASSSDTNGSYKIEVSGIKEEEEEDLELESHSERSALDLKEQFAESARQAVVKESRKRSL